MCARVTGALSCDVQCGCISVSRLTLRNAASVPSRVVDREVAIVERRYRDRSGNMATTKSIHTSIHILNGKQESVYQKGERRKSRPRHAAPCDDKTAHQNPRDAGQQWSIANVRRATDSAMYALRANRRRSALAIGRLTRSARRGWWVIGTNLYHLFFVAKRTILIIAPSCLHPQPEICSRRCAWQMEEVMDGCSARSLLACSSNGFRCDRMGRSGRRAYAAIRIAPPCTR